MISISGKKAENIFLSALLCYHFLFAFFAFEYFKKNGGDASFYWFSSEASKNTVFSELQFYGSDFVLRVNFFFAKLLHLGIEWGFVIYSFIGFLGIWQYYRLGKLLGFCESTFLKKALFYLMLLLPNLHFWTAGLGKESLCFLCLATFFYELAHERYRLMMLLSFVVLACIRPHVAIFLISAIFLVLFFKKTIPVKYKLGLTFLFIVVFVVFFYMVLQLSEINYFDWKRIQRYNEYSLLSFQHSNTYVPMVEYSYPFRLFTFWFRPFPGEVNTLYGWVLGMENLIWLLLHSVAVYLLLKNYKKLHFPAVFKVILIFALISTLIIVERYSGFGIFARTKIMMQPFVGVVLLWIFVESSSRKTI
ncbi:hypothetical protein [Flavobacterium sp.]|uniref:hypothetical protein n=1 Tax=Flavobacterium sp. TaxID=239 RepID=UPI0028BE355B|nr:hypothetical protein [Flavobacterium sp.]